MKHCAVSLQLLSFLFLDIKHAYLPVPISRDILLSQFTVDYNCRSSLSPLEMSITALIGTATGDRNEEIP